MLPMRVHPIRRTRTLDLQVDCNVYDLAMDATGLHIKDVAHRSGFSAATLRYYETIGLLACPDRTPAGYRVYDNSVLERLAFINRAKQLGCTLEEIADLVIAWDGGQCGPVQERLQALVAAKIVASERQIAELQAFTAELRIAAKVLRTHRVDGPCDSTCGCATSGTVSVELTNRRGIGRGNPPLQAQRSC
jgi:MerR family transcriptional regulator, copper efflux regulator